MKQQQLRFLNQKMSHTLGLATDSAGQVSPEVSSVGASLVMILKEG